MPTSQLEGKNKDVSKYGELGVRMLKVWRFYRYLQDLLTLVVIAEWY